MNAAKQQLITRNLRLEDFLAPNEI